MHALIEQCTVPFNFVTFSSNREDMGAVEAVLRSASGLGEEDPEAVLLYAVHAVMLSEGFGVAAVGEDAAFGAAKRVQEGKAALPLEEVESSPVSSMSRSPLSARGAVCYTSSINGAVLLRVAFLEGSCLVNAAFVPPNVRPLLLRPPGPLFFASCAKLCFSARPAGRRICHHFHFSFCFRTSPFQQPGLPRHQPPR
jgi:hypothetical protein